MAEKMVTRTFTGFNVTFVTGFGPEGEQTTTKYFEGTPKDKEKVVKKAIQDMAGMGIFKSAELVEEIRGMTVSDFYKASVPVTRPASQQKKPIEMKEPEMTLEKVEADIAEAKEENGVSYERIRKGKRTSQKRRTSK